MIKDNTIVTDIRQVTGKECRTETIVETNIGMNMKFKCKKCIVTVGAWTTKLLIR